MRTRHTTRLSIGLATMALAIVGAATSAGACVVGTGNAASCTDAALNDCLPGGAHFDGLVTFNCGGPATIDISPGAGGTGTKTISKDTTIDGGGLVTISGGAQVQVFYVNSGIVFVVQNLTIADGSVDPSGGGIYNDDGTVGIINSTLSGNRVSTSGGGLFSNHGTVIVTNSTFTNNFAGSTGGGGLYNHGGNVTVNRSTFDNNTTGNDYGGGIYNDEGGALIVINNTADGGGPVTVINSTFTNNQATFHGGGIYNESTLTVTNSTFSGNGLTVDNVAFTGGGIFTSGTATLTNVIIANTTLGGDCVGTVTDGGHNLIEDTGTDACGLTNATNGNIIGQDPNLDPTGLQSNGGPTQTVAVLTGSPAINAGDEAVCTADPVNDRDQRGYVRPGDGFPNCTIGAYEYLAVPPPPYQGPALSPVGLLGLGLLLLGAGWRKAHRASQAR